MSIQLLLDKEETKSITDLIYLMLRLVYSLTFLGSLTF